MVPADTLSVRRVEGEPRTDETTVAPEAFRAAMSRFASAVHIITTDGPAGRRGVTATAVVGVSDDPATMLVCLNAANPENERFARNGNFAVNVLAAGGQELAHAFSGGGSLAHEARFALAPWTMLTTGAPVLTPALVAFDCRLVEARSIATHHVLVGRVAVVREGGSESPLLYHARGYRLL